MARSTRRATTCSTATRSGARSPGDPSYKYGPDQGWHTTWWLTNTWYSDDPYGTVQSDPAWYFGDQTDRLAAAGARNRQPHVRAPLRARHQAAVS